MFFSGIPISVHGWGERVNDKDANSKVVRFMLRLPADVDSDIARNAQKRNRSKNNYIISILEQHRNPNDGLNAAAGADMSEQAVLKWFRSCNPRKKKAFLDFLQADLDD